MEINGNNFISRNKARCVFPNQEVLYYSLHHAKYKCRVVSPVVMFSSIHLIALLLVLTITRTAANDEYCPVKNPSDKPRFTQQLGFKDYVRYSHEIAILCCAEGYETITWYRQHKNIWQRLPLPPNGDDDTPKVEEEGQILRIFDAKLTDQTLYRCEVVNGSMVIQHVTDLIVIECDPLARGPYSTSPFPENQTISEYGGNITMHCTGYFGCHDNGSIQLAIWNVDNSFNESIEDISPRYKVDYLNHSDPFVMEAQLTITSVREEDTERTFLCTLANDQLEYGQTTERVRITKKEIPSIPWIMIGVISGGCGLFVILLISSGASLHCLYGPQIRLFLSSRISTLGPRIVDKESFMYNLFIYHASEDEEQARNIKRELAHLHYKVYITADIKGNQNEMNIFFEKSAESAMVMFLYSDALREDDLANFLVQSFIIERKGKDIMFLEIADYKPKDVMNWTQLAEKRKVIIKNNFVNGDAVVDETLNQSIENDVELEAEKMETEAIDRKETVDNMRFWKVLPRIKVPTDTTNKRKMNYFLCSLQNKIPRFNDQKRLTNKPETNRGRNSSSQKPLLGSNQENEPASPRVQDTDAAEFSPTTDEVFTFK